MLHPSVVPMDAVAPKLRHLHWWQLIVPMILLVLGLCSYVVVAFGPNLPVITTADLKRVRVSYDSSGALRPGDLILLVGDRSPEAWADDGVRSLRDLAMRYEVTVVRDGRSQTVVVAATMLPPQQMVVRWLGPLLLLLATLFVAALVGLLGAGTVAEDGLRLAFLGLAGDLVILPLLNTPPLNWIVEPLSGPFQVVSIGLISGSLVFFMGYPQPSRFWHERWLPFAIYGSVIGSGLLVMLFAPGNGLERAVFITERLVTVMALGIAVLATWFSVRAYRRTHDPTARAQLRWIAWGMLIGVLPWVVLFAVPLLIGGIEPLPSSVTLLPMLAVPISFALAILRFRLLDVDEVLNRSLAVVLLSLSLGLLYIVLVTVLSVVLGPLLGAQTTSVVGFLTTLVVATLFNPALRAARRFVNTLFYRDRQDLLQNVQVASRELRGIEGWSALLPLLGDTLPQRLQIEQSLLLLLDHGHYLGYAQDGSLVAITLPADWDLERPLVLQNWDQGERSSWALPLQERGFQLAFVLVAGGRPVGMYALGRQQSGGWYDRQSIIALDELMARIAGTVENARLIEQNSAQAGLRYELAIARRIQESLLPVVELSYGPFDVAAINLSASDVGGDLYALQRHNGIGLTMAVGDVSGKGVPAALLMAVTSAVLTTVSAEELAPDAVLHRVSRQLKTYTLQNRQNVALCYMSLTPIAVNGSATEGGYVLEAANAGAIPPLLRRIDGTLEWLDIGGLPLGSPLPNAFYPVATRIINPGDMLLLCTDGLLEAQSTDGELLSFDGVAAILDAIPVSDAQTTLGGILNALNLYTDGHEAQDDVTIMVVRIRSEYALDDHSYVVDATVV